MNKQEDGRIGWNYRIVRGCNGTLAIHQTIYDQDGNPETVPYAVRPRGEDLEDLQTDYKAMGKAFALPVIDKGLSANVGEDEPELLPASIRWEMYQEPNAKFERENLTEKKGE